MKHFYLFISALFLLSACTQSNLNNENETVDMNAGEPGFEESAVKEMEAEEQEVEKVSLNPLDFKLEKTYEGGALILRRNMEGLGRGNIVDLIEINSESEENRLGVLSLSGEGKVIFDAETQKLYFTSYENVDDRENSVLFEFDFEKEEASRIPIKTSEGFDESNLWDFWIDDDTIFYLRGICAEKFECILASYNLENDENKVILENIESGILSVIRMEYYDEQEKKVILTSGGGDAGHVSFAFYEVDIEQPELAKKEAYSMNYGCDETEELSEDCTQEEIDGADLFKAVRKGELLKHCPNEALVNQYHEDWRVNVVYCPAN